MRAAIVAVGSELLRPGRPETNGSYLGERLAEIGIPVVQRSTVADELEPLESILRQARSLADLVLVTGGLGPTADDLTRSAAAAAVGRPLRRNAAALEELKARFARLGRRMAAANEQQADLIEGATHLPNPNGTAPGQRLRDGDRLLVLLPGPPRELMPMFEEQVLPLLRELAGPGVTRTRVLRMASVSEGEVDQLVSPLYTRVRNPRTTILGSPGQVDLHLTAEAPDPETAERRIEELAAGIRSVLPGRIFSEDGRELHEVVSRLLIERSLTLAVAESCTGGGLAARLTRVPGASEFLERGFVCYSNRSKIEELDVDSGLLDSAGAVSEPVAAAMAEGARRRAATSLGIGITGIAGPSGGTEDKPVGLVYIGVSDPAGTRVSRARFPGGRDQVRRQACQLALELLRRRLLGLELP
jgi:nicotinamide-nucleotide amidase